MMSIYEILQECDKAREAWQAVGGPLLEGRYQSWLVRLHNAVVDQNTWGDIEPPELVL